LVPPINEFVNRIFSFYLATLSGGVGSHSRCEKPQGLVLGISWRLNRLPVLFS